MKLDGCFSHNTDNWKTPSELMKALLELGWIDTFPFMSVYDELQKNYNNQKLFVNPPYSQMRLVVGWIEDQIKRGNQILLLIPARTDTKYFHKLLIWNPTIFFIQGRLKFNDTNSSAPFPSIIMWLDNKFKFPLYCSITLEKFIKNLKILK